MNLLQIIFTPVVSAIITPVLLITGFFGITPDRYQPVTEDTRLGATIPTAVALFETTLASSITSSQTTMTLVSATTKDGDTLATGTYAFIIDEGTAAEEFVSATCVATACTSMTRGLSVLYGTSTVSALQKAHRRGASVKITDAPILIILNRIVNGQETLPNTLKYNSAPSHTYGQNELTTWDKAKDYTDSVAIAGAPVAETSVRGISRLSTAASSSTDPIVVGDNDGRVPTQDENNALVGSFGSPSTSNKYLTELDATSTVASSSRLVRYTSTGQITATTTPVATTDATSKAYVDASVASSSHFSVFLANGDAVGLRGQTTFDETGNTMYSLVPSSNAGFLRVQRSVRQPNGTYVQSTSTINIQLNTTTIIDGSYYPGISKVGNYLYLSFSNGASTSTITRIDEATLGTVTTMTLSGTAPTHDLNRYSFSDGTYLYVHNTTTGWYKYSISGTTLTYNSTVTIANSTNVRGAYYVNGYAYITTSDRNTIAKVTTAGSVSTTVVNYDLLNRGIGAFGNNLLLVDSTLFIATTKYVPIIPYTLF